MLNTMKNNVQTIWRHLLGPARAHLPLLTGEQLTKLTWARKLETFDAVPLVYRAFFVPLLAHNRPFPYTVLTPSCEGFLFRRSEKVVCDLGGEIAILERLGDSFAVDSYAYETINYTTVGTVLLDGWVRISGSGNKSTTFKFNTTNERIIRPFLEKIRSGMFTLGSPTVNPEIEKFNRFSKLNCKLTYYAQSCLITGDTVIHVMLQPEIRTRLVSILGRTLFRTPARAHISILTDRELILIQDDEPLAEKVSYGGISTYIALNKIRALSLTEKDAGLFEFSVHLLDGESLSVLFEEPARQQVDLLIEYFEKGRSRTE